MFVFNTFLRCLHFTPSIQSLNTRRTKQMKPKNVKKKKRQKRQRKSIHSKGKKPKNKKFFYIHLLFSFVFEECFVWFMNICTTIALCQAWSSNSYNFNYAHKKQKSFIKLPPLDSFTFASIRILHKKTEKKSFSSIKK